DTLVRRRPNPVSVQAVLLDRITRIQQFQRVDRCRLEVSVKKSIVVEKVIPVVHRRDPAVRKEPRERAHRKFAEGQAFLSGERLKIFCNRGVTCDRYLGIDKASEEK